MLVILPSNMSSHKDNPVQPLKTYDDDWRPIHCGCDCLDCDYKNCHAHCDDEVECAWKWIVIWQDRPTCQTPPEAKIQLYVKQE